MLNKELNAGLADSKIKGRIVELGGTVLGGSPAAFGTIIIGISGYERHHDVATYSRILRAEFF